MAVNRVEIDGVVELDISEDTVTESDVLSSVSFHDASGEQKEGSLIVHNVIDNLTSTSTEDALSANQGRVLDKKFEYYEQSGYLGKNLVKPEYHSPNHYVTNGITFDVNADGSVHVQGTSTGSAVYNLGLTGKKGLIPIKNNQRYRLSGCPSSGASNKYKLALYGAISTAPQVAADYGEGAFYNSDGTYSELMIWIVVYTGQNVDFDFKPMLVEVNSDGTYPTEYMPYSKSNLRLTNEVDSIFSNGYASRNLIPFPYYYKSRTINGVTFTVENGKVIANGTATAAIYFVLTHKSAGIKLKNNTYYRVSGCPSGHNNKISVSAGTKINSSGSYVEVAYDYGNGANLIITKEYDGLEVLIVISSGYTVNNVEFNPMLVEVNADGTYPTEYQKYIPSNIELNDRVDAFSSTATESENGLMSSDDKKKLNYTNIAYATCSTAAGTSEKVATIDGNDKFVLQKGSIVFVKYTVNNTALNCTLNVGGTGAKPFYYNNAVYTGNNNIVCGAANRTYTYMYDGTYWVWISWGLDNNTVAASSLTCTSGNYGGSSDVTTVQGALNNLSTAVGKVLTSTSIPSTDISYTFEDSSIKEDSMIDIYDTIYGFNPKTVTVTNGSCVITFDTQSTSHQIKLKIS